MPADDRLHPGHQLLERKRFGDIIVGAELEAGDAIAHGRLGADADQRSIGLSPKLLEELGSIVVWKHQVEEDDIGIPLPHELKAAVGRVDRAYRVALRAEAGRNRARKAAIVFDQRNLPADRHMDSRRNSGTEHALWPPLIGIGPRNGPSWPPVECKVIGTPCARCRRECAACLAPWP